jgi:hypothetical protein
MRRGRELVRVTRTQRDMGMRGLKSKVESIGR